MTNMMISPRTMNNSILLPLSPPNEIPQCKSDETCNESYHVYIHWFVSCATFMIIEYFICLIQCLWFESNRSPIPQNKLPIRANTKPKKQYTAVTISFQKTMIRIIARIVISQILFSLLHLLMHYTNKR